MFAELFREFFAFRVNPGVHSRVQKATKSPYFEKIFTYITSFSFRSLDWPISLKIPYRIDALSSQPVT
jgi:hypothetical protein